MPDWARKTGVADVLAKYRSLTKTQQRLILGAAAVVLLCTILHWTVATILGHELIAQVELHLHTRLVVDDISYHFPLGVTARNCELSLLQPTGTAHKLLEVKRIDVKLAGLPIFGGPIVVEEITVVEPSIHLIRTADGFAGQSGLVHEQSAQTADTSKPSTRLSDILRLHHVQIESARIVYEDLTRPTTPAAEWNDLGLVIDTAPRGPADYGFGLWAQTGDLAHLRVEGSFNVDEFTVSAKSFDLQVQANGDQARHLPPQLQEILKQHRVHGGLQITGSASAGPKTSQNSCAATIALSGASAYSPEADADFEDLHLTVHISSGVHGTSIDLSNCAGRAGNITLSVKDGAAVTVDRATHRWSLSNLDAVLDAVPIGATGRPSGVRRFNPGGSMELTAALDGPTGMPIDWSKVGGEALIYPRRMSIKPAGFAAPISDIDGGPIRFAKGVLALRDLQGHYGADQLLVSSVRLVMPSTLADDLRCTEINGSVILRPTGPPLPGLSGESAPQISVGGDYVFSGRASFNRDGRTQPLDCDLLLSCDNGTLAVASPKVEVSQIKFDVEALADRINLLQFKCQTFGGTISAQGKMESHPPLAFSGTVFTKSLSLPGIVAALHNPSLDGMNLQGLVDVAASVSGQALPRGKSIPDALHSEGQFELLQGYLWNIPVLEKVQNASDVARKALTIGQAAALFRIANDQIELQDAAVSAPIFGVQGSGLIGFNGQLNLHLVAAPLADWKQKMQQTGLGSAVSDFAGDVQKMLNKATSTLLYEFEVTGPASDPQVHAVPAPVLHDQSAGDLKNMMHQTDSQRPINMLQGQSK
jgi:hypothetical protein